MVDNEFDIVVVFSCLDCFHLQVGDVFMSQIQEMAAHVPYMVSPGNHGKLFNPFVARYEQFLLYP